MLRPARTVRAIVALALSAGLAAAAGSQEASELAVKAGFVYNFAKFTGWPSNALGPQVKLCLPGGDPMGSVRQLLDGRPLQGRPLSVVRNVPNVDLGTCNIVYITDVDERRQADVLRAVRDLPVLTIGDLEGFATQGGVIGLVASDDRVQFEVDLEASQRAGLQINSQLLKLARTVRGRTP